MKSDTLKSGRFVGSKVAISDIIFTLKKSLRLSATSFADSPVGSFTVIKIKQKNFTKGWRYPEAIYLDILGGHIPSTDMS